VAAILAIVRIVEKTPNQNRGLSMNFVVAKVLCGFPNHLHPASQIFLDAYTAGKLTTAEFLRFFSLPNSDYIPLGQCFINLLANGAPSA
jgi:hypothetical protein